METDKVAVIGFYISKQILSLGAKEKINAYISRKTNIYDRMLFTLADYLIKYSQKFDRVSFHITDQTNEIFPNGTLSGIIGMVYRSEIDIGVQPVNMNERSTQ